jgi:Fic family protein
LLRSKNVASAGCIIGTFDALQMRAESKKLEAIIGSAYGNIKIINPFVVPPVVLAKGKKENASARRIRIIWKQMRAEVITGFSNINPTFDFHSRPLDETLASIDEIYIHDAYHSLSIEGYAVTPELIEKVSRGDWSPETITQDNDAKNTLAARGYYEAFNQVKQSLTQAYNKEDLDYLIDVGITQWHSSMFKPCVTAGIISELDLAGYRKGPIYIRASRHVPQASEQLMDCMDALKECMAEEESFVVKAVLGHFIFGYIHPYFDGNERTARFLMNFLFVVGGFNWVIVTKEARGKYLNALESASVGKDIKPFAECIISMIESK